MSSERGGSPFPSAKCKTTEHIDVRLRAPSAQEEMEMVVRRPVEPVIVWRWQNGKVCDS